MHGIDVETAGHEGGGALRTEEGRLRLVQLSDGRQTNVYDAFRQDHDVIRRAIEARNELVAHNAVFERTWINEALGVDRPDLHDTMIMSQVYYTGTRATNGRGLSHSLQNVVKRELKEELSKDQQTSDWNALALTREQIEYAAKDAKVMPKLAEALMRKIERAGLKKVYELELRVSHAVAAMERRGVAIHVDQLDATTEEATEKAEALKAELEAEWGINPGSSKQLIEHFGLAERKGWPETEGGSPSTNQEAMKSLLEEEESVSKWLEWKAVEKIRSTYGESLRKRLAPEGRIHALQSVRYRNGSILVFWTEPSEHTQGRGVRQADAGALLEWGRFKVLIKADYASIELWVAAVLWDDPHMQRALRQGVNMHVATAASLFNVPASEVTKEQKATGKIVNFALLYGGSPRPILQEFTNNGMPIDEAGAETMHRKFFATPTRASPSARRRRRASYNASKYMGENYHEARTTIGRRRNSSPIGLARS
jgi:DNA polymerase-1